MHKLENEFWKHAMVGAGHAAYIDWFHELTKLVPYLVIPMSKRIDRCVTQEHLEFLNDMHKRENKFWKHAMVGAGHAAYIDQFHELAKLAGGLTNDVEGNGLLKKGSEKRKDEVLKAGGLTNDVVINGLLKKGSEKKKDDGETNKQGDTKLSNKRARTGKGYVSTDLG
nr:reverse transcriptase domain-containing protein [Tanacetum cinerariifolium]